MLGILTIILAVILVQRAPVSDSGISGQSMGVVERGSVSINSPAPVFTLPDLSNSIIRLDDYLGRIVIINFWASWCAPCKEEMPFLDEYGQEYSNRLIVLGVAVADTVEAVQKFLDSNPVTYPIVIDQKGLVGATYHVFGYPTTYFVDEAGIIRGKYIGAITSRILQQNLVPLGINK
jgi:cytochrome c biogenesis protein CcmG/thiol:disulfide interchange protein DsbE